MAGDDARTKSAPKPGPAPRAHNVVSYLVTAIVFVAVVAVRTNGVLGALLLPVALWEIHFVRRTLESALLHRYGKPSVPFGDAIQEYVYYWAFSAFIAWSITRDGYAVAKDPLTIAGLAVFSIGEAGNFVAHVMLARFRPEETRLRVIPKGFLFDAVSCPNYLFEILTWIGFAMVVRVSGASLFALASAGILADWARKRHAAYLAEFADYPKTRKRLVPYVF
jgi:very-long-chain enoyl-CoA reductase